MNGYEPRWDIDYALGMQSELLVGDLLQQLASGQARVEVKTSRRPAWDVFVEVEQKPRGATTYKPSGMAVTKAEYWAYVMQNGAILFFPVEVLRHEMRGKQPTDAGTRGDNPTRGHWLNIARLARTAPHHDTKRKPA